LSRLLFQSHAGNQISDALLGGNLRILVRGIIWNGYGLLREYRRGERRDGEENCCREDFRFHFFTGCSWNEKKGIEGNASGSGTLASKPGKNRKKQFLTFLILIFQNETHSEESFLTGQ